MRAITNILEKLKYICCTSNRKNVITDKISVIKNWENVSCTVYDKSLRFLVNVSIKVIYKAQNIVEISVSKSPILNPPSSGFVNKYNPIVAIATAKIEYIEIDFLSKIQYTNGTNEIDRPVIKADFGIVVYFRP